MKNIIGTLVVAGTVLGAGQAYAAPEAADTPADAGRIGEVVVTASVEPSEAKKLPASVQVVTRAELEAVGIRSLEDALAYYVPGSGNAQPGAMGSVGIRGFRSGKSASSVLGDQSSILIDGVRASTGNPYILPFAIIDRIEIVRGPAAVLYGSSAMGGVVNIITKRGSGDIRGEVGGQYGRFDTSKGHASVEGGLPGGFGFALGVNGSKNGNYRTGDGRKYANTESAGADGGGTLTWSSGEGTTMHFVGAHKGIYDAGSPGDTASPTPLDRVGLHYSHLSGELETKTDAGHVFKATVYGDRSRYRFIDNTYGGGASRYRTDTLGTRLSGAFSLGDFGRFSIGAEYANIRNHLSGAGVYEPDMRTDAVGIFAEYRYETDSLSWITGLRYDDYRGRVRSNSGISDGGASRSFDHVSWSTGGTYWLTDWLGVKASVGTSFAAPTAVSLAGNYSMYGGSYSYRGNPDLDAETALTGEAGFEIDYKGFKADAAYFQTRYKDRITTYGMFDPATWATSYTWRNAGRENLAGFDISLSYRETFDGVTIAPYLKTELFTKRSGDSAKPLSLPHHSTVAGLGLGWWKLWLDVNARFTGTQYQSCFDYATYSSEVRKLDGYTTVNVRLKMQVTDSLDIYCGVNNLTDRMYAVTYGYPMPGRAVYGGFSWKF